VLERLPTLKVCLVHGGGTLPYLLGRVDHGYREVAASHTVPLPPETYLRRFYFDTLVHDPRALAFLHEMVGAERLLFGTDYPYDMGESDPLGMLERAGLGSRAELLGDTAAALLALREWGLEPDKDVALVSLNESANIYAGMIGGAVGAGVLNDPDSFAAQKAGYPLLVELVDWPVDSNSAGFTTSRSLLRQNRPMLMNFLRGYMEGHKRFFEDRAYAIDVLRKIAKIDDPEVLDNTYALYVEKYFVKVPLPTVAGLQNIIDDYAEVNPRAKGIDATPMVDPSLVQDVQREGFFRQLGLE